MYMKAMDLCSQDVSMAIISKTEIGLGKVFLKIHAQYFLFLRTNMFMWLYAEQKLYMYIVCIIINTFHFYLGSKAYEELKKAFVVPFCPQASAFFHADIDARWI